MAAWLHGCMAAWLHCCMAAWLHGCMAAWLASWGVPQLLGAVAEFICWGMASAVGICSVARVHIFTRVRIRVFKKKSSAHLGMCVIWAIGAHTS